MPPLANQSLALVALQYELALLIGQELRLGPMLRRFFPPALKLLGCRAAHVWLDEKDGEEPVHRFAYPLRESTLLASDPTLLAAMRHYAADRQPSACVSGPDHSHTHFMALPGIGLCALVRPGSPIDDSIIAALEPIFARLATACRACINHESTEQLRALAAENEVRLRTVLETVGEVIFQTDWAGRMHFVNTAWGRITGFTHSDTVGQPLESFFHAEDAAAALPLLDAVRQGERSTTRFETRLRTAGTQRPWVSVQVRRRDNIGALDSGLIGTMTDISEQRQMIDELVQARASAEAASEAKSAFVANMSHEIRTPMNGIIGLAQLTLEETLPDAVRHNLQMILGSAEHLLTIINDILDFSKIEAGRLEFADDSFDLAALLRSSLASFDLAAQRKGLQLALELDPRLPPQVRGDPARLRQVLMNLLGNAVKFTARGSVRLLGELGEIAAGHCALRVTVVDTGIGIAADKQAHIFEPFAQADASINRAYGGTGLGLTISRRLVEMMGGTLDFDSAPGQGSRFSFCARFALAESGSAALPATASPPPATTPAAPATRTRSLNILVAEDNEINRRLMDSLLRKLGHQVSFAHDGTAAVQAFKDGRFDLVLMDMQMPVLDGIAATRAIRSHEQDSGATPTPIVALTANAMQGDRERCLAAGMDDYLAKPLRRAELERVLDAISRPED